MDDKIIKESPHIKYLGVILDNKLNWIEHIEYARMRLGFGKKFWKIARSI